MNMEPIYTQDYYIDTVDVDRFGRLKLSSILYLAQEVAGKHCDILQANYEILAAKGLFWAVTRHKIRINRLPCRGETLRIETWPMPTTRVAYPRNMVIYDEAGQECIRLISIWVLMDMEKRSMVLPGDSDVTVEGILRGGELDTPLGIPAKDLKNTADRRVCFTDLDRNGHMNNTRYLDWASDLLTSEFHRQSIPKEISICYFSEALEGQDLHLSWDFPQEGTLQIQGHRCLSEKPERVFSVRFLY